MNSLNYSHAVSKMIQSIKLRVYRGFLEHWNSQKSVCNIWQRFSCLLDEGIPKIWKKLNSHGGFLRADQGRAKMCCQMGWIGCAILQVAQKAIVRIQFLAHFWNPLINTVSDRALIFPTPLLSQLQHKWICSVFVLELSQNWINFKKLSKLTKNHQKTPVFL